MKRKLTTTLFLIGSISHIIACSGPGAPERIRASIELGYYYAFGSIVLTLITFLLNRKYRSTTTKILLAITILLTIFHPGFWIGARSGDCGMMRIYLSKIVTGIIGLISLLAFIISYRNSKINKK